METGDEAELGERFGKRVKQAREAAGLTIGALAQMVGVTEGAVRQMESGQTKSASFLVGLKISHVLNLSPWELAGEAEPTGRVVIAGGRPAGRGLGNSGLGIRGLGVAPSGPEEPQPPNGDAPDPKGDAIIRAVWAIARALEMTLELFPQLTSSPPASTARLIASHLATDLRSLVGPPPTQSDEPPAGQAG